MALNRYQLCYWLTQKTMTARLCKDCSAHLEKVTKFLSLAMSCELMSSSETPLSQHCFVCTEYRAELQIASALLAHLASQWDDEATT